MRRSRKPLCVVEAYRGFESLPLRSPSRDPAPRQRFHGVDRHSRHEHSQPVKARQGTRLLGWISVDPPSSTNTWVAFVRAAAHSGADRRASSLVIHLWSSKNRESGNSLRSSNADAACGLTVLDSTEKAQGSTSGSNPPSFPRAGSRSCSSTRSVHQRKRQSVRGTQPNAVGRTDSSCSPFASPPHLHSAPGTPARTPIATLRHIPLRRYIARKGSTRLPSSHWSPGT